ncbi:MAG: F0F1 ATP synthase subunit alpha [Lentisphaerae bacterium]|nr:F0F1 ATP synthase subunit alpha [Lentisphaerota bacterium]
MSSATLDSSAIASILEKNARDFSVNLGLEEIGHVLEVGDGIARVDGLPGVMCEEMVVFPHDVCGMAMNLGKHDVGVVILGDYTGIEQGDVVRRTCELFRVPVGEALLGRVVNVLGHPIDAKGPVLTSSTRDTECLAPGIVDRVPVHEPLQTGLKSVDAMTAVGRGQRELLIGDRQTGKTTLAIDTILNQKEDVVCVYVAIGQKMSTVSTVVETLQAHDVLRNCIVVAASASDSAPLQYMAPFSGCAMAEYFRDAGRHALIVYDDLSKHAVAYREISLLLKRPPGREAYPGDIFYLHSRLLERASKLSPERGGGSLTALPIIETQEGDYSSYIPTNLISITDGQIYLESSLFHQGFKPAVNVGLSVSRVGGKAQLPAMRKVAGRLRIELAQYREVAAFAQLTTDLDPATLSQLHRGERLAEMLKQKKHEPLPVEKEVLVLWTAIHGHLDEVPLLDVARLEKEWLRFVEAVDPAIVTGILETGDLTEETGAALEQAVKRFKEVFVVTGEEEEP